MPALRIPVTPSCSCAEDSCLYCNVRIDWLRWSLDGVYAQLTVQLDTHPTGLSLLCSPDQFLYLAPFLTQQPLDGHLTLPLVQDEDGAFGIDWAGALQQHQLCIDELQARPAAPAFLYGPPPPLVTFCPPHD